MLGIKPGFYLIPRIKIRGGKFGPRFRAGLRVGFGYLGWPSGRVRLLYFIISILSAAFPGTLVYLILWFAMPEAE
jgi:phage shock protein PspC (stress-responsive transcriptional regulator)